MVPKGRGVSDKESTIKAKEKSPSKGSVRVHEVTSGYGQVLIYNLIHHPSTTSLGIEIQEQDMTNNAAHGRIRTLVQMSYLAKTRLTLEALSEWANI
jgi:tRNA G46 methylase TrmB